MSEEQVHWKDIESLANKLGSLGGEFTEADRRTLQQVFDAAHDELTRGPRALPADAKFISGPTPQRTLHAFKVSELYTADPADEKPPDSGPSGT